MKSARMTSHTDASARGPPYSIGGGIGREALRSLIPLPGRERVRVREAKEAVYVRRGVVRTLALCGGSHHALCLRRLRPGYRTLCPAPRRTAHPAMAESVP